MSLNRLLIVEDDAEMAVMLTEYLQKQGFFVTRTDSRAGVMAALAAGRVDLMLMDVNLGTENGVALCAELRRDHDMPIIMVSALSADHQHMDGYAAGADDYIAKPFNPELLAARVRAVLRRTHRASSLSHRRREGIHRFAGWRFDSRQGDLTAPGGWQVMLSGRETALLRVFLANPNIALRREEIAAALEDDDAAEGRAIDVLVGRLRQKLADKSGEAGLIRTERGTGYVFSATVETDG